jgi:hypothetical protein
MTAKLASLGLVVALDQQPLASAVELGRAPAELAGELRGLPLTARLRELIDSLL